jgi:PAS domain S-box-containing protein
MIRKTFRIPVVFFTDHDHLEPFEQIVAKYPYFQLLSSFRPAEIQMVINKTLYMAKLENKLQSAKATKNTYEEFQNALLENAADAIFLENFENKIIDVSKKACDLLGYTREELNGMKLSGIIAPEKQLDDYGDRIGYELKKYDKMVFESVNLHKSGKRIPVEVTTSCVSEENDGLVICIVRDLTERKQAEHERERLITDLNTALAEVRTLRGILPICCFCKKIRDDQGYWNQIESYLANHTEAEFSHSICLECAKIHYPDIDLNGG